MKKCLSIVIVTSFSICFSGEIDNARANSRMINCGRQAQELGMSGATASAYMQRCVAGQPTPNPPRTAARTASCNRAATELGAVGAVKAAYVQRCVGAHP